MVLWPGHEGIALARILRASRDVPGPGFLEARRASSQDATRSSDRLAIASVLLGGIVVGVLLVTQLGSDRPTISQLFSAAATSQPLRVQSGHIPTPADSAAPTVASGGPTVAPVANPAPGQPPAAPEDDLRRHIGHTDGAGVVLRASPRDGDWTPRGFMDGDWVTVLDQPDPDWVLVQGDNGQQGWIPAQYVGP